MSGLVTHPLLKCKLGRKFSVRRQFHLFLSCQLYHSCCLVLCHGLQRYMGQFYMDHLHGKGICYWPDGSKFTGALYLGHVEGYGTLEWKDGRKFQWLYKSDKRFGQGIESYPDGCQDVGLWLRDHLINLTEVPGYFSLLDYPAHYRHIDDDSQKKYISVEEDPFLHSYKHLPFDDKDIFREGVFTYSYNTDHLTLTHSFLEECDACFFQNTPKLPEEDTWPIANLTPVLVRMQTHVYKHSYSSPGAGEEYNNFLLLNLIPQPQAREANLTGGVTLQLKNEAGPPQEYFSSYSGPVPEEGGRSALHICLATKRARDVIHLLLMHQANPNTLWSGHSPLSLAIASGNDLAVVELLKHGADPNLPLSGAVRSALCAAVSMAHEHQRTTAQRIALVDKLLEAGADILAPVTMREGQRKAVGTAVDYAYYKYYQDKRIAHTPYHILSASEQEVFQTCRLLLEHITVKLREHVTLKEKEWDQEELRRSKKLDSAIHRCVSKKGGSYHVEEVSKVLSFYNYLCSRLPFFKYCYQCGRSVGVQLSPCMRCHEVFTCSETCRRKSWNEWHRQECLGLLVKSDCHYYRSTVVCACVLTWVCLPCNGPVKCVL
ncbi:LOW QUALITY PROTEIN: ankyrin repeat and MYND domain-containing protein 1-like [Morphnus guianensis]